MSSIILFFVQQNKVIASESTDNMTVSTPVAQASCNIGTIDTMDFGTVSAGQTMTLESASIRVTCSSSVSYNIYANAGNNDNANQRRLKNGTAYIEYDLYESSSTSNPWDPGSSDPLGSTKTGNGSEQTYTVYGKINSSSLDSITPASYDQVFTDTVTITITMQ